jgi:hypothetical protein
MEIDFGAAISVIWTIITECERIAAREPDLAIPLREIAGNLRGSLCNIQAYRDIERTLAPLARALNRNAGRLTLAVIADGRREDARDTHAPRSGLRELYDSMVNLAATILHVELPDQAPLLRRVSHG